MTPLNITHWRLPKPKHHTLRYVVDYLYSTTNLCTTCCSTIKLHSRFRKSRTTRPQKYRSSISNTPQDVFVQLVQRLVRKVHNNQ